ncbi:MAG TPA: glycosyltransferase family 39 protein [Candidatus Bathyarchaeia archaeon]|nr:glycosyltransferase family 39 protein [Candidatus Bathyarchaeia archaeon]
MTRLIEERPAAIALAICAVYVLALAYPARLHQVEVFSDFYARYAPDADLVAQGKFPSSVYNPPGYSAVLVLLSKLTGDHFTSGKWLSLGSAGLTGLLSFHLFRRLFGAAPALLAVPIILLSGTFNRYTISAMTDVPFLCVSLLSLLVITDERPARWHWTVLAGVLCGIAYLLRYNGLFLLVPGLTAVICREGSRSTRAWWSGLFLLSFAATAAPWWWANAIHHGSPFYSRNFVDVAGGLGINPTGRPFTSLGDVILSDPALFAWRWLRRAVLTFVQSLGASLALLPVGPLALVGLVLSLLRRRTRPVLLVLCAWVSFLLVMSLTHWEARYFFFLLVCNSGFASCALFEIAGWAGPRLHRPAITSAVIAIVALWILVPSAVVTWREVRITITRQPFEILPAARALAGVAPPGSTVMSSRAQIAYLSGLQWREMPTADSIDAFEAVLRKDPPDFLVFDRWARRYVRPLGEVVASHGGVSWLQPIYQDPQNQVVIYAVRLRRSD